MLSENEIKIVEYLKSRPNKSATAEEISDSLGIPLSSIYSLSQLLKEKGYVRLEEKKLTKYELTDEGKLRLQRGMPEDVLIKTLNGQSRKISELKELMGNELEIALGWARRKNLIKIEKDSVIPLVKDYQSPEVDLLRDPSKINDNNYKQLLARKLISVKQETALILSLAREDITVVKPITYITTDIIKNHEWEKAPIKEYNVEAEPPFYPLAKKHFFKEFLEKLRDVMINLGFTEVKGNYVELEFYNFDLLFQAQDHPAREIHDSFMIEGKGEVKDLELMNRVKEMHKKGWKYEWEPNIALRLVLRSQTTAVTSRVLSSRPRPPIRTFTIGKVFRPDSIDATHLIEFHQLDGLVVENGFAFRDLLGVLKEIFYQIGIKEIKFKPAYFPFTEPSVEVYGKIEGLGWVEMSGAGLLRPEILEAVGIDSDAGAWGIGIDRLAMLLFGLKDIRLLYANNVDFLRNFRG
ncbi:phenylalanine--tRNA ligase subunit alpha [Stygiolobus caldivivus]|uniref:Phenylalanine--tRNA ligase alpha subunit n=1 Tax=Stygiolobus caldivivus TaxID=2824673 RepID=A0A8D5ZKI7_9CREN|nr:phenylalanine--tRNA ligase subunit alpha [Stygiolobus caldivivus]BCU71312.1 phenylalanine--tRNA ligase subunit alpha [Stygiolobus caldivivus]